MSNQSPMKKPARSILDIAFFQQGVVELDESSEESLSAGAIDQSGIKYPVIIRWNSSSSTNKG